MIGQHETYFKNADAFVVCYAVDDRKLVPSPVSSVHFITIQKLRTRSQNIRTNSALSRNEFSKKFPFEEWETMIFLQIPRMLVATKLDSPLRQISLDSGNALSAQLQCSFAETSAEHDINVVEVLSLPLVSLHSLLFEVFEEVVSQIRYVQGMKKKMEEDQTLSLCRCLLGWSTPFNNPLWTNSSP